MGFEVVQDFRVICKLKITLGDKERLCGNCSEVLLLSGVSEMVVEVYGITGQRCSSEGVGVKLMA